MLWKKLQYITAEDGGKEQVMGPRELKEQVLDKGLCTGCGACVNLCPYFKHYKDHTIVLYTCDRKEGRCYAYCPRTAVDLGMLQTELCREQDLTAELGPFRGLYMTRAKNKDLRAKGQHGATASTLIALALEEDMIETAILGAERNDLLSQSVKVSEPSEVGRYGRSKFVVLPTVAAFNEAQGNIEKIGVVTLPCQALAFAKMRSKTYGSKDAASGKLKLVIGLFCGWALSWRKFNDLLERRTGEVRVLGVDIPPSRYRCMEVYTAHGDMEIPIEDVLLCVRESCRYCLDMTCEFSDISIGSARSPEGWKVDRGWNQVIVRTAVGEELLEMAKSRGLLEFRKVPEGNLEKLKKASMNKKRVAIRNILTRTGRISDLLYLSCEDPVVRQLLAGQPHDH